MEKLNHKCTTIHASVAIFPFLKYLYIFPLFFTVVHNSTEACARHPVVVNGMRLVQYWYICSSVKCAFCHHSKENNQSGITAAQCIQLEIS